MTLKLLALSLLATFSLSASWDTVQALAPGARLEITRKSGDKSEGVLRTASADSVTIAAKQQEVSVARADIARIAVKGRGRAKWIGLAIGAGAGAGAGAALGTRLANESAGDINLKGGVTAACAAVGGLIGLAIGATLDAHHSVVYVSP